jgi:two-component system chemotaxis response regulator CheY
MKFLCAPLIFYRSVRGEGSSQNPGTDSPGGDIEQKCVLVVDDLPGTRAVLCDMLHEIGIKDVRQATDGRDALERLKESPTDLIISDYAMWDMSGLDSLYALRKEPELADIPFLMVSARTDFRIMEGSVRAGAAAYIFKPVDFNVLKNTVLSLLGNRSV